MCSRVLLSSDGSPFVKSVASCLRKLSFETEGCGWSSQKILDALEKVSCDLVCILTIDDYDELRSWEMETMSSHRPDSALRIEKAECSPKSRNG